MTAYLALDALELAADPELVGLVPYGLAAYYQALPLAREDDLVTVIMAHPENRTALAVLSSLLGGRVVAVQGDADAIRAAIRRAHPAAAEAAHVLAWRCGTEQLVEVMAARLAAQAGAPLLVADSAGLPAEELPLRVQAGGYRFAVLAQPAPAVLAALLRQAAAPLLLVRGPHAALSRVLVALRGFASDEAALRWAEECLPPDGSATVMPLLPAGPSQLAAALQAGTRQRGRLDAALAQLEQHFATLTLKLRQGDPVAQVAAEAEQGDYDLLVLASEGEGVFVSEVLAELDRRGAHSGRPVLIVKPQQTPAAAGPAAPAP